MRKILLISRGVIRNGGAKDMRTISKIKEQIKYYIGDCTPSVSANKSQADNYCLGLKQGQIDLADQFW
jgi:hypothetical protein